MSSRFILHYGVVVLMQDCVRRAQTSVIGGKLSIKKVLFIWK